jgi:xanthine dehydrogenase accessory factor
MKFWEKAKDKLLSRHTLMLMIVVKSEGSSPGKAGFKMMASDDGEIWGSIGGGNMEYRLTEQCRRLLKNGNKLPFIQKQDHHPDAGKDNSGMICSGVQWVAFYTIGQNDMQLVEQFIQIEDSKSDQVISYTEKGISISAPETETVYPLTKIDDNRWNFAEQPGLKNLLCIFGAGHVSLALSKLAKETGFDVWVFDNRNHINTFDENVYADKKEVIDYGAASKCVNEGNHVYVAIMTFAHKSDTLVLKQMINKKLKYLGMMGSDLKVRSVFDTLEAEGYTKETLSVIDAPIGIPINSITPSEIAVSIMAKMIAVKNS